ncbi:IncF plasmid conjugative transfer pilus assembly protein TraU [hydrothermal vent metagenome]|uniref:IncF plasmid conjugative transfer pilus assembly protein TraU n=1 Tax=hydrothermal vent metagenome TaxID=652676 RepID=A0A3B0ZNM1_9ZZZZ
MKRIYLSLAIFIGSIVGASTVHSSGLCQGRWVNPITDICWKCLFPISLGAVPIFSMDGMRDIENPPSPICVCPIPVVPWFRVGLTIGFWEPARISEIVRTPYCFPTLGGLKIDTGIPATSGGAAFSINTNAEGKNNAFYQAHWYKYPILYILELITNTGCKSTDGFDIAYITELDPMWRDSETAFILNPESAIFANPIAVAACAGDCVQATRKVPIDKMFWCAGCQGTIYPIVGHLIDLRGVIHASLLATQKLTAKLARLGLTKVTSGASAMCFAQTSLILKKSQYRTQQVYPKAQTGSGTFCCNPYGADSTLWSPGHHFPNTGQDFAYLIWRKRNCCLSY